MRVIVHLSDIHFGRVDPATIEPLASAISRRSPHLLAVSGDLTQRARRREFAAARAFLDALPFPRLVIPGNHDVPLHNVFTRFLTPLARYRHAITERSVPGPSRRRNDRRRREHGAVMDVGRRADQREAG